MQQQPQQTRRTAKRSDVLRRAALVESLEGRKLFAFGVTTGTTPTGQQTFVIDNGGDLKAAVIRGGTLSSTIHMGDLSSVRYKNQELLAPYSTTSRYSHYEQGLTGAAVVSTATGGAAGSRWILVTADDSAATSGAVIQYYAVRENDNNLYLASLPRDVNNGPGEGRFIAYLQRSIFSTPEDPSDNAGNTGAIEGGDVFGHADGTTSSKFYNVGGRRQIEHEYHGLTGTAGTTPVGAWMFMGSRERSAGGPFFRDIDFQSSAAIEIYNVIFSGHTQTETYRQGLHTYAMQFNGGAAPAAPDYSWMETAKDATGNLLISGLVPAAERGAVSGTATGNPSGHEITVGLSNAEAQYWDVADAAGNYSIAGVLPGTYTQTLYDNELAVGTRTVTVAAGRTTAANIVNAFHTPSSPVFRIGTWDGTPLGFLNADKIETMHPSDVRMGDWTSTPNFVVGTHTDAQFPMASFMGVNNGQRITFNLTAAQVQNLTLRIGITLGFEGARPKVTVNGGQSYAWTSANPSASRDLNSRGVTRGTWRGDNQLYTFPIPGAALRAGTNTIDLPLISGSFVSGQTWLSPNAVFDAIDLVPTSVASPPAVGSVAVTPAGASVAVGATKSYAAVARDAAGNVLPANVDWTAARGTVDARGNYVAPDSVGSDTVTALARRTRTPGYNTTASSTSAFGATLTGTGSTNVNVVGAAPSVATAASASPSPSFTNRTTLTALGSDADGESNLTYTWSVLGTPPAPVTFAAANGTNAGKGTLATFAAPGTYAFRVTITNGSGLSTTSDTSLVVFDKKAWLRADETGGATLADASGANNDAALAGTYSYIAGVNGNAVKLAGGHAALPTGIVSGLDDFTIGVWVKPDSLADWARLFDFGTGTGAYMFLAPKTSTSNLRFAITTGGGAGEQRIDGPALTVGAWTHVAVTLLGNTATMYVNGVAVGSNANVTLRPSSLGSTANNYLGKSQFAADPALMASVDDFRLYGRALTAAQVAGLAAPAAPSGVTATAGDAQVALAWTAAAGATSYSVKRSTTSGGPYATIAAGLTSTGYSDATAANGTTYYYVVTAVNAGASTDSAEASATPLAPAPKIASFAINGGAAQRSMLKSLTLDFDRAVSLGGSALSLTRGGAAVAFVLSPADGPSSQYTLTFSGSGIVGGSLADGVYTLAIDGSGVTAAGGATMAGSATYLFHRLFGDINGDRTIGNVDTARFRRASNTATGDLNYDAAFDYDNNGLINNVDLAQFRRRDGVTYSY